MKYIIAICSLFLLPSLGLSQYYFPPTSGTTWDTLAASDLGWCQSRIDSLYDYLDAKNTKSFIVLKDGKRVLEKYFGTYTQDSMWYWASAGKSLASVLVGIAQEKGYLDINDPVSNYLGTGWTSETPSQEIEITVRNQISMTTGLEFQGVDLNCMDDTCLTYRTDPDSQWYYHNAPYRLVQDVVANASGKSINLFTYQQLGSKIGMGGLWINYIRYGKARDMARFGLLCLNNGVWASTTVLGDTAYLNAMKNTSNLYNKSYGYLWWLNGKSSHRLPGFNFNIPGPLIPSAPSDMYAALGKNDQKIYVVPSKGLVVVRQGNSANGSTFALSSFDDSLWTYINNLSCTTSSAKADPGYKIELYPNPASESARLAWGGTGFAVPGEKVQVRLLGTDGALKGKWETNASQLDLDLVPFPAGMYLLQLQSSRSAQTMKFLKRQ